MVRRMAYAAFGGYALVGSRLISSRVPDPYMDELFHVPQAQAYCRGEWSTWDPLLTTPPGLYLISAFVSHALPLWKTTVCHTAALRLVNVGFLLLLPWLCAQLLLLVRHPVLRSSTKGKTTPSRAAQIERDQNEEAYEGLVVATFPLVTFFAWLYYTDLGSLVLVLLSYREGLRKRWALSALAGSASLLFRQTNIAWIAFVAASCAIRELQQSTDLVNPPLATAGLVDIPPAIFSLVVVSSSNVRALFPILRAYAPVFVAAVGFVAWNGSIVLGDKSNHVPTVHIPQLYYFAAFSAAFLSPALLSPTSLRRAVVGLVGSPRRLATSLISVVVMCYTIKHYTIAHPFLLADNRHYTFYAWRRILNVHPLSRYALAPGYLLAMRLIWDRLVASSTVTLLPFLVSIVALALTLVPSPLIEPRYFIIPFILLRLHLRIPGTSARARRTRLVLELLVNVLVTAATVWIFVEKPFEWQGRVDKMRFMW